MKISVKGFFCKGIDVRMPRGNTCELTAYYPRYNKQLFLSKYKNMSWFLVTLPLFQTIILFSKYEIFAEKFQEIYRIFC